MWIVLSINLKLRLVVGLKFAVGEDEGGVAKPHQMYIYIYICILRVDTQVNTDSDLLSSLTMYFL